VASLARADLLIEIEAVAVLKRPLRSGPSYDRQRYFFFRW